MFYDRSIYYINDIIPMVTLVDGSVDPRTKQAAKIWLQTGLL